MKAKRGVKRSFEFNQHTEQHGDSGSALDIWYRIAKRAEWKNLMDVRRIFPTADAVGKFTVFNIKGNEYRLISEINYPTGTIFLRHVLTHAEYSKPYNQTKLKRGEL